MRSIRNDINFEALQREIDEAEDYLVRRSFNSSMGTGAVSAGGDRGGDDDANAGAPSDVRASREGGLRRSFDVRLIFDMNQHFLAYFMVISTGLYIYIYVNLRMLATRLYSGRWAGSLSLGRPQLPGPHTAALLLLLLLVLLLLLP
jgi:hypothetical protein